VDTSKKVEKSYTPTPEKKEEGGGNAMILLSGKQADINIKHTCIVFDNIKSTPSIK
jgi:hypothetical protein